MSTAIQRRRGTTAEHASFAGLNGELTVDTTKKTVVVHDGATAGGFPLARQDFSNVTSLALPLGTAGAPVYSFTGDTNTGIYSPGADQVAISTNGTGRLFVDASGNVGAGTSSPAFAAGGGIQAKYATFSSFRATVGANTGTDFSAGSDGKGYMYVRDNADLLIGTNNTERLRITSAGLVGVGTSNPGQLLTVNGGDISVTTPNGTATQLILNQTGQTAFSLQIPASTQRFAIRDLVANSERLVIDSSGRVGIGTSSPLALLDVRGNVYMTGNGTSRQTTAVVNTGGAFESGVESSAGAAVFSGSTAYASVIGSQNSTPLQFGTNATIRATLDTSGRLGIGTTSPSSKLSIATAANSPALDITDASTSDFIITPGVSSGVCRVGPATGAMALYTGNSERARIDSSGRLLVGTSTSLGIATSLGGQFQVADTSVGIGSITTFANSANGGFLMLGKSRGATVGSYTVVQNDDQLGTIRFSGSDGTDLESFGASIEAYVDGTPGANDMPGRLVFSTTADGASSPTERMKLDRNGVITLGLDGVRFCVFRPSGSFSFRGGDVGDGFIRCEDTSANAKFTVSSAGNGVFAGSLSKGSGSFKISHPLPEKTNTHYLVHSFIEGPQADLIYRGHIGLVDGTAQVNIDKAGRMTEGTFEALCTNVCCFTSNETDWTPVRGHVDGNILTIEAQDPTSTAKVCWMVIGERKDQHMLDTDWTDKDGRVITEPLKDVVTPEAA